MFGALGHWQMLGLALYSCTVMGGGEPTGCSQSSNGVSGGGRQSQQYPKATGWSWD
jgi:hypothetical protein